MEDDDVEQRLRAYRPAAPSPELRDRIIGDVRVQPNLWMQFAAAAALLMAALLLQSATERIDRRIAVAPASAHDADQQALDELTRQLGDDPSARLMAQAILVRERQTAPVMTNPGVPQ